MGSFVRSFADKILELTENKKLCHTMKSSELLKAASRLAESKLARVRILKNDALATIVHPGSEGKFLIAVEGAPFEAAHRTAPYPPGPHQPRARLCSQRASGQETREGCSAPRTRRGGEGEDAGACLCELWCCGEDEVCGVWGGDMQHCVRE